MGVADALRASLPTARYLLVPDGESPAEALDRFAGLVAAGLTAEHTAHLVHFAVRVGARRLVDTAAWLARLGLERPSAVAELQARLVGGLQHPLMRGDRDAAVELLRRLAPTYAALDDELAAGGVPNGRHPEQFVARSG